MPKDRLLELQIMADKYEREKNKSKKSKFNKTNEESDETTRLTLDEFTKQVNELESIIENINEKLNDLEKLYVSILTSFIKNDLIDEQIEKCSQEITGLINKTKKQLEFLKAHVTLYEKDSSQTELRVKKAQLLTITTKFNETKKKYDKINDDHKYKLKEKLVRHLDIVGKKIDEDELDKMIETGNLNVFNEEVIIEAKRLRQTLHDVEDRHQEFLKIEKSIQEINELMKTLMENVQQQGQLIDSAVDKTNKAMDDAKSAKKQTEDAVEKKRKSTRIKCYLIIIVTIVVVIILITIALSIYKSLK